MKLNRGCPYCNNLERTKEPTVFECPVRGIKVKNAGACFVAEIDGKHVIIEDCPDFKNKQ
jgi:hypothetical protein